MKDSEMEILIDSIVDSLFSTFVTLGKLGIFIISEKLMKTLSIAVLIFLKTVIEFYILILINFFYTN